MQMGEGYDPDRFVDRVLHGFKCCICQCVLNEPRLCEAEKHKFCLNCISQHLPNSQTCPECRQPLTLETLKCPGNYLNNILSELRIQCDYINRGCLEHVELGNLQNHVNNCEYRPVTCEECHLEVNAKDEDNHKRSFCQLGGANIPGLKHIKLRQEEMKEDFTIIGARQKELADKLRELNDIQNTNGERLNEIENDVDAMQGNQLKQNLELNDVYDNIEEIRSLTNTITSEVTAMKRRHSNVHKQVKKMKKSVEEESEPSRNHMRIMFLQLTKKNDRFKESQEKLTRELLETKRIISELKSEVKQLYEKLDEPSNRLSEENLRKLA